MRKMPIGSKVMLALLLAMLPLLVLMCSGGCSTPSLDAPRAAGDCPDGNHVIWGDDGALICAPVRAWPPSAHGSRGTSAACALADGEYQIGWQTDVDEVVVPAFAVTTRLSITGETLALVDPAGDRYEYRIQWRDAATADTWLPGSQDIRSFTLTCSQDGIQGTRTDDLPYLNPGRQHETWIVTGRAL